LMRHLSIPFLASDLDGTLLDRSKEISPENRRSIERFRRAGGGFTVATGRSYMEAKRFIRMLELDLPVILCNGAMMYDPEKDTVFPVRTMERELMLHLLKDMEKRLPSSIDLFAYAADQVYAVKVGPFARRGLDGIDFKLTLIDSFERLPDGPLIKIIAVAEKEEMVHVIRWSESVRHLPLEFVQSSDHYYEILPQGVSKGNALASLLKRCQLSPRQAAAIGDHMNDLSMLKLAGLGAAVANAHPDVLRQADLIVPTNNEHGVSYLIEHYLLTLIQGAEMLR
jgi:Cof subfamily protein (haloacid dehalogenase superfamily)